MIQSKILTRIFSVAALGLAFGAGMFVQSEREENRQRSAQVELAESAEQRQLELDREFLKIVGPHSGVSEDDAIILAQQRLAFGAKIDGGHLGVPLHHAIAFRADRPIKLVTFLLDNRADPNARTNDRGETPLMNLITGIAFNGNNPVNDADKEMMQLLLTRGTDANAKALVGGWTALHYATLSAMIAPEIGAPPPAGKFVALATILKAHNANPLATDAEGRTALDILKADAPENKEAIAFMEAWEKEMNPKPGPVKMAFKAY